MTPPPALPLNGREKLCQELKRMRWRKYENQNFTNTTIYYCPVKGPPPLQGEGRGGVIIDPKRINYLLVQFRLINNILQ